MNIEKTAKYLLHLSNNIYRLIDKLSELSKNNLENTAIYQETINELSHFYNQETKIYNSLNEEAIAELLNYYSERKIYTDYFERCIISLYEQFNKLYRENYGESYELEEENNASEEKDMPKSNPKRIILNLSDYYMDTSEIAKYKDDYFHNNSISAMKLMKSRISSVEADNKNDRIFQKRLLNYLKVFKYSFFSSDRYMEELGIKYRFDYENIPNTELDTSDLTPIIYNFAINLLDKLYSTNTKNTDYISICYILYDMISFELCLEELGPIEINNLIEICFEIEKILPRGYYASQGLYKLLAKKKQGN